MSETREDLDEREVELSTGERRGACRRRLREIIEREDCEPAAGVTREELATLSTDEANKIRELRS